MVLPEEISLIENVDEESLVIGVLVRLLISLYVILQKKFSSICNFCVPMFPIIFISPNVSFGNKQITNFMVDMFLFGTLCSNLRHSGLAS